MKTVCNALSVARSNVAFRVEAPIGYGQDYADMAVTISESTSVPIPGANINYTQTISNLGTFAANSPSYTVTTQPNAILVPSQAVQTGQNGQFVFVVKPGMKVEMRSVVLGRTVGLTTFLLLPTSR